MRRRMCRSGIGRIRLIVSTETFDNRTFIGRFWRIGRIRLIVSTETCFKETVSELSGGIGRIRLIVSTETFSFQSLWFCAKAYRPNSTHCEY